MLPYTCIPTPRAVTTGPTAVSTGPTLLAMSAAQSPSFVRMTPTLPAKLSIDDDACPSTFFDSSASASLTFFVWSFDFPMTMP